MVTVNSGACEPTDKFENTPRDKWHLLLITKRSFLDRRLKHDCRCLIEFCEEAESVFAELGYKSAEDMIREGYELDPTQIELAVAWLKHNEPQHAIGLKSVSDAIELARANKDSVQGRRTDLLLGDSKKLGEGNTNEYLLRRLARDHDDILAMVESGELSVNAAAIRAGIRKKPTPLQELLRAWKKATKEERTEFMKRKDQQ
jgi:Arc/MetJ-type ribon-helix-helix transcriptional regulator